MEVTLENYQELAHKYANYENDIYPYLGLQEEIGEAIGKIAKSYRGDKELDLEELKKELGDCIWMLSEIDLLQKNPWKFSQWLECKFDTYIHLINGEYEECRFLQMIASDSIPVLKIHNIISYYNLDLKEILQSNINKLEDRFQRGVIKGNGDNR